MARKELQPHRVYLKQRWQDEWTLQENLFCDEFSFACAPEVPTAMLWRNYGRVEAFGKTAFATINPLDVLNYFVRIELLSNDADALPFYWYGIITGETSNLRGGDSRSGVQMLQARGLEHLLERERLTTSYVMKPDATFERIGRAIGFNLGGGHDSSGRLVGNRSTTAGLGNAYGFCDKPSSAAKWTAYTIVDYLLTYMSPKNVDGEAIVPFQLSPAYKEQLLSLDWWKLQLDVHGRSLKEILDALISRRRLMSYILTVDSNDDGELVYLRPFTFASTDISLPGGNTIRMNPLQTSFNFSNNARVKQAVIIRDAQAQYDVVRAVGERIGVVWTAEAEGEAHLVADWSESVQDLYNGGSPEASSETDHTQKVRLHRQYRQTEKLKRAYRYFRISGSWDGQWYGLPVVITPESEVGNIKLDTYWLPGMRIEPYLPLKVGTDYATISASETNDTTSEGQLPDYRKPFVIVAQDQPLTEAYATRYFYIDRPEHFTGMGENAETGGRKWTCSVRPQDDAFGLIIDVQGAPQHVIAKDEFTPADAADTADFASDVRWQKFEATIYVLLDRHCYGQWPEQPPQDATDVLRVLEIDCPGKRVDYVAPFTTVDLDDACQPIHCTAGGFLEDDRAELKDIARLTYDWYATPRYALEVVLHSTDHNDPYLMPGYLLRTIGELNTLQTVNSVVTHIHYDLRQATRTIRTQFAELDLQGI